MAGSYQGFGSNMGSRPATQYSGWGQSLPYTGQRQPPSYQNGGFNPSGGMPPGGMMSPSFEVGQGRPDPYAGGYNGGGINPGGPMGIPKPGMSGPAMPQAAMDPSAIGQIRDRLRPVMGNLVDSGNFGQFIQAQAGGTSLDPSMFGVTGKDQYGRDIWRMGQNNVMGYGDPARVQQRIMGEGGGGPLNTWASQLTGQAYNPANPFQLQGAAADTRTQGRQAVAPGLLSMLQGGTPSAQTWQNQQQQMIDMLRRAQGG